MTEPVRFAKGSDSVVEGWGMPFFGPFEGPDGIGRDFDAEFFSPNTDFLFDWFKGERPTLYHHTWDKGVGTDRLGGVISHEQLDKGIWTRAQLDIRSKWYEAVRELVGKDALSFSSGAYPAGVEVAKSGEIMRWPWVELTLTPTPANPYASIAAMKSMEPPPIPVNVGVTVTGTATTRLADVTVGPEVVPMEPGETVAVARRRLLIVGAKAAWSAQYINDLPDSAFACIDAKGRHYPHHNAQGGLDMPHLRNAMSRMGDMSNTQCGKEHLMRHARASGMGE